jgi:peptidoglycan/LPS O-acetylase OafA/YrhL
LPVQRSFRGGVESAEAHISTQRFAFVDALSGLAALSVVLYHAYEGGHIAGLLAQLPAWVTHLLGKPVSA